MVFLGAGSGLTAVPAVYAAEREARESQADPLTGPAPHHPERLIPDIPPSPEERDIWAQFGPVVGSETDRPEAPGRE
ncbi:DUF6059 family protein [Actinoallomurus sp. CA-150999]|uniref:DUF6059 family protein n=1 Tax=Actinoallomurus sp. CA-150999 TaxID=3239887 RepID=UPI003D902BF8